MATLKEIAEKSGVSIRTVSRIIKGNGNVSVKALQKVRKELSKMEYTPNLIAKALKSQKTGIIGIVAFSLKGQVRYLDGLQARLEKQGYKIMLTIADADEMEYSALKEFCMVCEAILFLRAPASASITLLEDKKIPYLLVNNPEFTELYVDRKTGIFEAFERTKHKHYDYYIYITSQRQKDIPKRVAFDRLAQNQKSKVLLIKVRENDLTSFYVGGYNVGDQVVKYKKAFIFCAVDRIATGLLRRMNELQLQIPDDYAVLGFDDDLHAQYMSKSLSSISLPVDELCDKTVLYMNKILSGEEPRSDIQLLTHFVERETT